MKSNEHTIKLQSLTKMVDENRSPSINHLMEPVGEFLHDVMAILNSPDEATVHYARTVRDATRFFPALSLQLSRIHEDAFAVTSPDVTILTNHYHELPKPLTVGEPHDAADLVILRALHPVNELICETSPSASLLDIVDYLRTISLMLYGLIQYLDTSTSFTLGCEDVRPYAMANQSNPTLGISIPVLIIQTETAFFELALGYPTVSNAGIDAYEPAV